MKKPVRRARSAARSTLPLLDLAMKTGEMALASAHVIDHRTRRMANAGLVPNARDRKEFTLMGQEKVEAAMESAQALALGMARVQQEMATAAFQGWWNGAAAACSLLGCKTPLDLVNAQTRLAQDAIAHSGKAGAQAASLLTHAAAKGLKPVHSRATANARRLGRIKPR